MKSPFQDRRLQTSCKDCIFAIYDDKTQIDCGADRIKIYESKSVVIPAYDENAEFFVIDGFCNFYRNNKWNNGIKDLDKINEEASVSFDVFIDCTNISEDNFDYQYMTNLVENTDYFPKKINFNFYHDFNIDNAQKEIMKKIYKQLSNKINMHIKYSDIFLLDKILSSNSSFFVNCEISHLSDLNQFHKINDLINHDLKKFLIYTNKDTTFISTVGYKLEYTNSQEQNFEFNLTKLKEKCKEQNFWIIN